MDICVSVLSTHNPYQETKRISSFPIHRGPLGGKATLAFNISSQVSVEIHLYSLRFH